MTFRLLPDYAQFLLESHLDELVRHNLSRARQVELPLLQLFSRYSEEQLFDYSREHFRTLLSDLSRGVALQAHGENLLRWQNNQLPGISRSQVNARDLSFSPHTRRYALVKMLRAYTRDLDHYEALVEEIDYFFTTTLSSSLQAFVEVQQEDLRQERDFLQTILNTTQEGISALDRELKVTHWNRALEKRTGVKKEAILGRYVFDVFPRNAQSPEQEAIFLAQRGEKVRLVDLPIRSREGYFDIDVVPLHGPEGAIVGTVSLSRDVTARHQADQKLHSLNSTLAAANEELSAQHEELQASNEELHEHLTRLEEAQQALSESEARLREAQAIAHLGHWFYESESGQLYWSEEMRRIFGREPVVEELTGEGYLALVPDEDREVVGRQLAESIRDGAPFTLEHRLLRPDGSVRWILVQGTTEISPEGDLRRMSGTCLDITERKEAELALKAEKYFIEKLTDASPDVITLYDLEQMRNLYSSREVYSILGYNQEELRQIQARGPEAFAEYFHPEDLPKIVTFLAQYKTYREEAPREMEYRIKNASGEWVTILDRYRVFKRNREGLPVQIMGVARDISERKRAEREIERKNQQLQEAYEEMAAAQEELRQSNEMLSQMNLLLEERVQERTRELAAGAAQLQLLTDSLPVLISYVDQQGRYQFNNQTYEEWFGLPRQQVYGKTVAEVLGPEAYGNLSGYVETVLGGQPVTFTTELPFQRGGTRLVSALYVPHRQQDEVRGYYALVSDVTEQQKTQLALEQALEETRQKNEELEQLNQKLDQTNQQLDRLNKDLDRTNKDLDTFVYTASHDLRAPIANLTGLQRVLIRKLAGKTSQEEQELLALMNQAVERLSGTINVLTQVVKVQKESQPAEVLRFEQVLDEVKYDLSALLETAQPVLRLDLKVDQVSFPRQYLRSIVYNLLSNALKYRSPARPLSVKITTFREGDYIVFCVEDNGLGIAPNQMEKVFQMFKRLHTHVEGTGIGLYMVRQMVENYGGKIQVESQPDQGAQFKVYFPG